MLMIRYVTLCPHSCIRELSSPRDVQSTSWQSASWRICELTSNRKYGVIVAVFYVHRPASASYLVHDLRNPTVDQSVRCPVCELSSPRLGNPLVGISTSCAATVIRQPNFGILQSFYSLIQ